MRIVVAAIAAMAAGAAMAGDTESVKFKLINHTKQAIVEFYASAAGVDNWEDDVLGGQTLDPGESATITIDDGHKTCKYDFLATFKDGDKLEKYKINICELDSYEYTE